MAGEAQRLLLCRTVEATLGDAMQQGLQALLVDDLHFADEASLGACPSSTPRRAHAWIASTSAGSAAACSNAACSGMHRANGSKP